MAQPRQRKQKLHPAVAQTTPRQLQHQYALQKLGFSKRLQISLLQHSILRHKHPNIRLQTKQTQLLKKLILLVLLKQKVQINSDRLHVLVVQQNLVEEVVLVRVEEDEGVFGDYYFFGAPEEFYCFHLDFVEVDAAGGVGFFAEDEGFFVDAAEGVDYFFLGEEAEDAGCGPDSQMVEQSFRVIRDHLMVNFHDHLLDISDRMSECALRAEDALVPEQKIHIAQLRFHV